MAIRRVSEGSKCFESLVFFNPTILNIHIYIYNIYIFIIYIYIIYIYWCARSLLLCTDLLWLWHVRATLVGVHRLLIAVASLVTEHGLLVHGSVITVDGLGNCGS